MISEIISKNIEETQVYGESLAKAFPSKSIILLNGDLGSGKTTFSKGFARGLEIKEHVGSPTFKIVSEYIGNPHNLYHVDCYRLKGSKDFLNFGGENLLLPENGVTLIEWAEIIEDILPDNCINISFKRVRNDPNKRLIKINRD